ncbi:hypothetical protein KRR26_35730 [Corallococcus sp. M34]|uniref:hypothetical protein n=1 Tax=Citreicoccus inhibens TaxID=2849499 RepID=UPI001C227F79|nr:hypothetical protein [Citreicoccus inhibens]MBU8900959.1 hypothetical protein [Citreicoccus inhibens]
MQKVITAALAGHSAPVTFSIAVDQNNKAEFKDGGACSTILEQWIRTDVGCNSPAAGSVQFASELEVPSNRAALMKNQKTTEDVRKENARRFDQAVTPAEKDYKELKTRIDPLKTKEQNGSITPKEQQQLKELRAKQSNAFGFIQGAMKSARMDTLNLDVALGAGLRFDTDCMDVDNLTDRLRPIEGKSGPERAAHISKRLDDYVEKMGPGYYRVSMYPASGSGHVVGLRVAEGADQQRTYKFLDPNTGEFTTGDRATAMKLLEHHATTLGYAEDFTKFTVDVHRP